MSRRDTIIIAVLINAGLLVVLFSTALKSNNAPEEIAAAPLAVPATSQVSEIAIRKDPVAPQGGDEVDQVLSQFTQTAPSVDATAVAALPSTIVDAQSKNDFAQDLNAISLPQSQAQLQIVTAVESSVIEVTVKKGDILDKIARQNHTTVEQIMRLNNLNSTRLKIGQVLKVAPNSSKKATATPVAAQKNEGAPKYYTVKNGDNPWTIAVKNHMKVDELLKLNNMDQEKARHLKPGDQIRIR